MFEERFLEQALEELEYWKKKYEDLRKEAQSLVDWVKETYKGDNEHCEKKNIPNT